MAAICAVWLLFSFASVPPPHRKRVVENLILVSIDLVYIIKLRCQLIVVKVIDTS